MPAFIRAQVSIPSDSTVPADAATNTFHFFSTTLSVQDTIDSANSKLTTFYNAVDGELSSLVSSPATVKYYDLTDNEPRVPVDTETIVLTPGGTNGFLTEAAICISYSATAESGQPIARRRGRIYFGPVNTGSGASAGGRFTVTSAVRTVLANAASGLAGGNVISEAVWSVFSPTTAGSAPWSESTLESAFFPIALGYVDDAYDVVRSRGTAATARTTWTA